MKHNNIWTIGIPEGRENEQVTETLFEKIMTKKFLNTERWLKCQVLKTKSEY